MIDIHVFGNSPKVIHTESEETWRGLVRDEQAGVAKTRENLSCVCDKSISAWPTHICEIEYVSDSLHKRQAQDEAYHEFSPTLPTNFCSVLNGCIYQARIGEISSTHCGLPFCGGRFLP